MQENHSNKTLWRAVRCLAVLILGISMCAIQYNTFTKDANTFGRSSHFRKLRHAPNGVGSAVRGLGTGLTAAADIELARNIRPLMQLKDAIISGDSAVQAQCLRELDTITDAATRERLIGLTNEAAKAGDSDNAFRSRLVSAGFEAMDSSEAIGNFNNYHTMNRAVAENLKNQEDAAKRIADGNLKMERDPNNPNIVTIDGPTAAALDDGGKLVYEGAGFEHIPGGGARVDISKMDPEFQGAFSKVCDDYFSRSAPAAPATESAAPALPTSKDALPLEDIPLGGGPSVMEGLGSDRARGALRTNTDPAPTVPPSPLQDVSRSNPTTPVGLENKPHMRYFEGDRDSLLAQQKDYPGSYITKGNDGQEILVVPDTDTPAIDGLGGRLDQFSKERQSTPAAPAVAPAAPVAPGNGLSDVSSTRPTTDVGLGKGVTSTPLPTAAPVDSTLQPSLMDELALPGAGARKSVGSATDRARVSLKLFYSSAEK